MSRTSSGKRTARRSADGRAGASDPTALLRERIVNRHVLRGFGPFVVAIVLIVLMVIFVPSVAPERETMIVDPSPTPTASP